MESEFDLDQVDICEGSQNKLLIALRVTAAFIKITGTSKLQYIT